MKIVIYRPYTEIWFKNQTRRFLNGTKLPNKYEGLFDYLATSKASLYVSTGLIYKPGINGMFDAVRDAMRLIAWCLINRINLMRVKLVFTKKGLRNKDILFFMHYGNFTNEQESMALQGRILAKEFSDFPILKVVHMTHYAYNVKAGADNLATLKPDLLIAENDLMRNSPFFRKYFAKVSANFYHLPYTPASRFIKFIDFKMRSCKLVVTGSITYKMRDQAFVDFYSQDELQPMRREIFQKCGLHSDKIESYISDLNATRTQVNTIQSGAAEKVANVPTQRSYYSMDIVNIYNSFAMFAVPEEICDLPGIGFIEGMACGAAYFGLESPMYLDLGMIPGTHYVAYDGTFENLVEKIAYYQKNLHELEIIANNGYEFAHRKMNQQQIYGAFLERISSLTKAHN